MAAIDALFTRMMQLGASDLHLATGCVPQVRVSGSMIQLEGHDPLDAERLQALLGEITPERNRDEFRERSDTDFAYELGGAARFRANLFLDRRGVGAVFRLIPSEILTAEQLGLPDPITELCTLPKGLVLVTGPTGSGKSTTLAAMIDRVNRTRADHIITIEDPVEFVHVNQRCHVNQREVHSHTRSFAAALRAALREDPDVILVGELRDLETTEMALETAETGHLVFATVHTTTAATTVNRIIDQFPGQKQEHIRTLLAASLRGVVSQSLLRRADGKGRVAAMETLIVTPAVSALIREGKSYQIPSAMQTGGKYGMKLLNDALADLVRAGTVTREEAMAKAVDREGLERLLAGGGAVPAAAASRPAARPEPRVGRPRTEAASTPAPAARAGYDDFEAFRASLGK